jgi:hypothetical protein
MPMPRRVIPELLDDDLGTEAEIAASLVDLRRINNWFGGTKTTVALLHQVAERSARRSLSLLEVGVGTGDVPAGAASALERSGIELRITLLDRMWTHLPTRGMRVSGDALQLPFRDGTFDVVSCTLFAHHFEPDQLRQFTTEALRVCQRAVLINDLIRSRLHLALVYAGLPLFRGRITWHDAPASVRRGYTCEEMQEILYGLPATRLSMSKHYLYRMGVLVWKESDARDMRSS